VEARRRAARASIGPPRAVPLHPRPPVLLLLLPLQVWAPRPSLCASAWNHVAHGRVRVADPSIKNGGFNGIRADCRDARATTKNFCECATRDRRGGPPKAVVRASVSSALILSTLRSWCLLRSKVPLHRRHRGHDGPVERCLRQHGAIRPFCRSDPRHPCSVGWDARSDMRIPRLAALARDDSGGSARSG
jgi:hypothetical protein